MLYGHLVNIYFLSLAKKKQDKLPILETTKKRVLIGAFFLKTEEN